MGINAPNAQYWTIFPRKSPGPLRMPCSRATRSLLFSGAVALLSPTAMGQTDEVAFDNTWTEQKFLRIAANQYALKESYMEVQSDSSVSLLWRSIGEEKWLATSATWNWSVGTGVRPTDLTQRGGDDRNLSLYFIFASPTDVKKGRKITARYLFQSSETRALVYVWGGEHQIGQFLDSPYSDRMTTVILQTGKTGEFSQSVNLDKDFRYAFGDREHVLVGIAVAADSDDTSGSIRAKISDLRFQ